MPILNHNSTKMEDSDERLAPTNFSLERPTLRGIYLSIIRPTLAEFYGVFFLTFGSYGASAVLQDIFKVTHVGGGSSDVVASIVVVFLYIGIYSVTRSIR